MFKDLFNFRGVNWWTLLGGIGLNFVISSMIALVGSYLSQHETLGPVYQAYGQPVMMLAIFLLCGLNGFVIGKIADNVPIKHAFWGGMGAAVPWLITGVMSLSVIMLMMSIVSMAGNLNGAMLSLPRGRGGAAGRG